MVTPQIWRQPLKLKRIFLEQPFFLKENINLRQKFDALLCRVVNLLVQLRQTQENLLQIDGSREVADLGVAGNDADERRDDAMERVKVFDFLDEDCRHGRGQEYRQLLIRI